MVKPDCQV
jgi:hypothetical protein